MRHLLQITIFLLFFFGMVVLLATHGTQDLLVVFLCFAVMAPVVYLVVDRFRQRNKLLEAKEEALRAELALLKNQINPHFFFNTLNNLYGLATARSELAPQMILKLSDLMRFTIYEGKKDHVLLRDEIAYLENYLEIQRIRAKLDKVDLRFEKEVADDLIDVPPLMLIMLVENAVKHGSDSLTGNAFIHIRLEAGSDWLIFEIANNFTPAKDQTGHGIGLKNLERRLALLFPGRHDYKVAIDDKIYKARLRLDL